MPQRRRCDGPHWTGTSNRFSVATVGLAAMTYAVLLLVLSHSGAGVVAATLHGGLALTKPPPAPKQGNCRNFYWGGTSNLHYYACCNNCNEPNPPSCDGVTYQAASNTSYCGPCGQPTSTSTITNGGFRGPVYSCGGCAGQTAIAEECRAAHPWIIPGGCWIFTGCMKARCRRDFLGLSGNASFCGDGSCNANETVADCPYDCCPEYDAACNVSFAANGTCTPPYCGEPNCQEPPEEIFEDISHQVAQHPPIGAIVDWWNSGSSVPPSGYEFCDGSPVATLGSPIWGIAKPDLRGAGTVGARTIGIPSTDTYQSCSSEAVATCSLEVGIDYNGNDVRRVPSSSAAECCQKCAAAADCSAFTYTTIADPGLQNCIFKTSDAGRISTQGCTSGFPPVKQVAMVKIMRVL